MSPVVVTISTPGTFHRRAESACKGIFESIAMLKSGEAWICPTMVEVCRPKGAMGGTVQFQSYTTNYGGPLRKSDLIRTGNRMQVYATVLAGVCYRLYGDIRGAYQQDNNVKHYLKDLFDRRILQGRCYRTPSLGWREFTCSYWGKSRSDEYEVDGDLNMSIPSMLVTMWDRACDGHYSPRFTQNAQIERGVLLFAE